MLSCTWCVLNKRACVPKGEMFRENFKSQHYGLSVEEDVNTRGSVFANEFKDYFIT